jgi:hypothetical protein
MPIAAGGAMIAFAIFNEYNWFDRTLGSLPDGFEVLTTNESKAFYRPWTYAYPFVDRFAALDTFNVRTNPSFAEQRMVDVYLFGRWQQVARVPVLVDCVTGQRADLIDGMEFDDSGGVQDANWIALANDDPLRIALCAGD